MKIGDRVEKSRGILLIVILGILSMMAPLGIDMYLPGLPSIAEDLQASPKAAQFTLSAFMLGFAFGQLIHGPAADSYGRKRVLIGGTLGYCVFSALCAMASNIEMLVWLRLLQGLGGAASGSIVFALLRDLYSRKEDLARMMSFVTLVTMLAPLMAPLTGGYLLLWFGWRAVFWVLTMVSLLAVFLVWLGVPETLKETGRRPMNMAEMIRNYRRLLTHREVLGYLLTAAFPAGGMFAFITAGSFVYIDLYGVSPQHFGFYFGLNIISMMCFVLVNGRMVQSIGVSRMLKAGLAAQSAAGVWLAVVVFSGLGFWALVAGIVVFVGSIPAITSNAVTSAMSEYPHMAGALSSLAGMLRFGTGSLSGALVAMLPSHTAASMALTMTCCTLLAVASYCLLTRTRGSS
jgi:DHA1 family bicyclomycin/chloramphenicol resistance-like MFS transporter